MSVIQAEGQFSRVSARGDEIGIHDAMNIDRFLQAGLPGRDKHCLYELEDPIQREAHETFGAILGIPLPDLSSLEEDGELQEEVTPAAVRQEAHLVRQVIAHRVGVRVFYWAHID